jgi:predicted component of type VI protein secretion system
VIRAASRDLRVPQESFVLGPANAAALGFRAGAPPAPRARLVVVKSTALDSGQAFEIGPVPLTIGRATENSVALPQDDFASSLHARIEAQRDDVWIVDLGSTNGTLVNGRRIDGRHELRDGDLVRIGDTELRFDR